MANNPNRPIPRSFKDIVSKDPDTKECAEEMLLNDLNDNFLATRNQLVEQLERGKREIERALESISRGNSVNSMGVLQSTGRNIDTLSAQLYDAAQVEMKTAYALGFAKPSADTCWRFSQGS